MATEEVKMLLEKEAYIMIYNNDLMELCKTKARLSFLKSQFSIIKPNDRDNQFAQAQQEILKLEAETIPTIERALNVVKELLITAEKKSSKIN